MKAAPAPGWRIWADRGGTFTDLVALDPSGALKTEKLLSDAPQHYDDAILEGIRRLLAVPAGAPIPDTEISELRIGTTVATNALLEHQGAPVLLITTSGFADLLRIAQQHRPELFTLDITLPRPLYQQVLEVDERISAQGEVLRAPVAERVRPQLEAARARGLRSCAIVLLHSYVNATHEQCVAQWAAEAGFTQISVSSALSPVMRAVARGDTTVVDASLSPIVSSYVKKIMAALPDLAARPRGLRFMQSSGGLVAGEYFHGKDAILSGPAGGVVGMVRTAEAGGFTRLLGFDMGGTSTDVCHYAGRLERRDETEVAGFRLQAPMLAVHTVAAGGGSILHAGPAGLRVGPDSAGADPGPAAYGKGGPLTVTDANVLLGRLQPDLFPRVFGTTGQEPLNADIVVEQFQTLAESLASPGAKNLDAAALAEGFIAVAIQNMALAMARISSERGIDLKDHTLCCFGGAGGQHACQVAEALGVQRIHLHPLSGLLSAVGMGLAVDRLISEYSVEAPLSATTLQAQQARIRALEARHAAQWGGPADARHEVSVKLKAPGAESPFLLPLDALTALQAGFRSLHRQTYGFDPGEEQPILHSVQVESTRPGSPMPSLQCDAQGLPSEPTQTRDVYLQGRWQSLPFYRRSALTGDVLITGPAVLLESHTTVLVLAGWQARLQPGGDLVLQRQVSLQKAPKDASNARSEDCDPVQLALVGNRLQAIAEEMGVVLARSARSVNIRERLDFSCAVFSAEGALIANAPHVPVHLGSMGFSVQAVHKHFCDAEGQTRLQAGDVCLINDPYGGGTHLPDLTVVRPGFLLDANGQQQLAYWLAARGHHADVGGIAPGSMPWNSTRIDDEGLLIAPCRIVKAGVLARSELNALFAQARNPTQNIADLQAQIAACARGDEALRQFLTEQGQSRVLDYFQHLLDQGEAAVKRCMPKLKPGHFSLQMDQGVRLQVQISLDVACSQLTVDFTGSSAQTEDNFNAPLPVVHAAVLYVLRCLVGEAIPLNAGCLRPVKIIAAPGSCLNPHKPAAVVAGNVEVSQALVCLLFGALGVKASAQGTMNNILFGNERYQYYETLCGGDGATAQQDGASAVQTHMTNSRLTDVEVLEARFPVRVESFARRQDSGGRGAHCGGEGVRREIRFLETMQVNLLSNHRCRGPFGLAGGQAGQPGRNVILRASGETEALAASAGATLECGDRLLIETPGGGGFGTPEDLS